MGVTLRQPEAAAHFPLPYDSLEREASNYVSISLFVSTKTRDVLVVQGSR